MKPAHNPAAPLPFLQRVLRSKAAGIPTEALAGITLPAIAVPKLMRCTKISGTPVITGRFTMLIPAAATISIE